MPFKSKAQARAMHAKAERGEISKKTVHEFDVATKKKKGGFSTLPERIEPDVKDPVDKDFRHSTHGKKGSHE